ncbi:hypothetical protein KR51_00011030 [Rubidibacter lacunae KORDI 51-2]|uniref:Uncharacterized protein n=1 Tax=Rubidibacter lacunae KORDI 51-2 TaxID=582515 RepID=U5DNJ4_9CHRO|nr:hypothetical protein KR51_00011030 [Rubidibacter lacunae KORDI 51-2]
MDSEHYARISSNLAFDAEKQCFRAAYLATRAQPGLLGPSLQLTGC